MSIVLAITLVHVFYTWHLVDLLFRRCLPPLLGGISAGFIAERKGWVLGFLVAVMLETFGCVVNFFVFDLEGGMYEALLLCVSDWWLLLPVLVAGAGGGYLGELLYKTGSGDGA